MLTMASATEDCTTAYSEIAPINPPLTIAIATLTSLPTIPFDLIADIICYLPVKLLLQLKRVCKSWKTLISDPKFAKKHLTFSTTRRLYFLTYSYPSRKYILSSHPLPSVFTSITTDVAPFEFEYAHCKFENQNRMNQFVGSCNGILCLAYKNLVFLLNPSTRKYKELPYFENPHAVRHSNTGFGFGYDSCTDTYKVVVILPYIIRSIGNTIVKVHYLGTSVWKCIQEFLFDGVPIEKSGKLVSGTINWLASIDGSEKSPNFIISFDLGNESFQKVLPPSYGGLDACCLTLGVMRDCLCIVSDNHVWIMKEYGIRSSWTKLFTIPYIKDANNFHVSIKAVYIFEDGQVLLKSIDPHPSESKLAVYDSRNGTLKYIEFQNIPEVCVESLISPYS